MPVYTLSPTLSAEFGLSPIVYKLMFTIGGGRRHEWLPTQSRPRDLRGALAMLVAPVVAKKCQVYHSSMEFDCFNAMLSLGIYEIIGALEAMGSEELIDEDNGGPGY